MTPAQLAIARAEAEWKKNIHEPPGENWQEIDKYIRSNQGLGWSKWAEYVADKQFQWCGAFVAFAQAFVKPKLRFHEYASTSRLYGWAKKTPRDIPLPQVQPGDIVIVGKPVKASGKKNVMGSHITLAVSVDLPNHIVHTIEGNAGGTFPDGETGQGVIRQERKLPTHPKLKSDESRILHVYRPLAEDMDQDFSGELLSGMVGSSKLGGGSAGTSSVPAEASSVLVPALASGVLAGILFSVK